MLADLASGFQLILDPVVIGVALIGLLAGLFVGALPGLTATMAVAVLAPFTFIMEPLIGLPFLLGVYKGAIYAGSIPAILINTPGTAAAAATAADGNAMARSGRAREALEISLFASVIADFLATIVLVLVAAPLAAVAIKVGSAEFTLLYALALTMVAAVSGDDMLKGLIAAALGVMIALVGLDPMSGAQRYTFGLPVLLGGISLIPLLIGMFALSEIMLRAEDDLRTPQRSPKMPGDARETGVSLRGFRGLLPTILRSTGIGTSLGSLPGLGAEISCWVSYGLARRASATPERFGKGAPEGVAAAEAGNNAVCPAALIPMTVFGIPGDTITAVLLGAFMAQGLTPGPLLFSRDAETVYALFAFLFVSNVLLLGVGIFAIRYLQHIVLIPANLLYPVVAAFCFAGAYAVNNAAFDLVIMLAGGIAGYAMRKTGMPIPPLVIGMLLAPGLENSLRQALTVSRGSFDIFVTRPGALALLTVLCLLIALFIWRGLQRIHQAPSKGKTS
ncbi:tripartite tricarboxylate transporter permease [Histidinibacterium aquaticum]|uniref:C4-dicarboxylate ABC transporter permease n=1 Tax=Histidinibacterium aquaticum TaxID=2613962 RepID=A0A5J5GKX9_9RHOB|nr:tripartite tricarboxylate transporter permease [Histidinibacterium aquaticum]KAA9008132.1 C4-dicarboxylate ABC transporter permease [Histidinibacterium aquaticum]